MDGELDCSRSGLSGNTHNSQSLSLGSSLDNLLLVDSSSHSNSQSGLSPRGNGGGNNSSGQNRISVSSNVSISGQGTGGLASLSNYDPDLEELDPDGDSVFEPSTPKKNANKSNNKTELFDEEDDERPPTLPEKQNRRHFLLGQNNNNNVMRCPSPYENVDETDLATWHGNIAAATTARDAFNMGNAGGGKNWMSYSESRNTLVGAIGYEGEERPPLPPKKKHSLSKHFELYFRS
jgi:hypothetical protein